MVEVVKKDATLDLIYSELRAFVYKQLWPLKEEIEKEEILRDKKAPCTVISFIDYEKRGIVRFSGYTKELLAKMKSCFSKSDFDFIYNKIESYRRSMDN